MDGFGSVGTFVAAALKDTSIPVRDSDCGCVEVGSTEDSRQVAEAENETLSAGRGEGAQHLLLRAKMAHLFCQVLYLGLPDETCCPC